MLETSPDAARAGARAGMAVYLRAPNYLNNLLRMGFTEADWADGGTDRLVDAIVAWGSLDDLKARVQAHLDAGANHVCVQVLRTDREIPLVEWRELAGALL